MKNPKNHGSTLLPILLAFVLAIMMIYPFKFSGNALALDNQTTTTNDSSSSLNWLQTINLGKPIYFEKYVLSTNESELLPGNGTLMGKNVTIVNETTTFTHPKKSNIIFIEGNAQLTTTDGNLSNIAPYTSHSIGHYNNDGSFVFKGVAFFSSNATGTLSTLSDMMGIYKGKTKSNGDGGFIMWKLD